MNLCLAMTSFTCVVAVELRMSSTVSKQCCAFQGNRFATLLVFTVERSQWVTLQRK